MNTARETPAATAAAALQPVVAEHDVVTASDELHGYLYQQRCVLVPMIRALFLLANSQRVIEDLETAASNDSALAAMLSRASPSWRDPTEGGFETLAELARAAQHLAVDIAGGLDQLWLKVARDERDVNGGAA